MSNETENMLIDTSDVADDKDTASDVMVEDDGAGAGAGDAGDTGDAAATADDDNAVDQTMKQQEAEMMSNLNEMRKKTLKIGTKVLTSKYGPSSYYANVGREINRLVGMVEHYGFYGDLNGIEKYLNEAEELYYGVEACFETRSRKVPNNDHADTSKINKHVSNVVSHVVTDKGDEHDVRRCISVAEKALANSDLQKAEKFLLKAERIRATKQARQLLKQLEEAKKAKETPKQIPLETTNVKTNNDTQNETHIHIDTAQITDDTNYKERNKCMDIAKEAIADKNFEKAQRFLHKAQRFDPLLDIKYMLDIVEDEIKRKAEIDNRIKLIIDAIAAEDYEKALDYINEVNKIDPKADVYNLKCTASAGFQRQQATLKIQQAKSCIEMKNFEGAEEFLRQVKYIDPERDIYNLQETVKHALALQKKINGLKKDAESAIKNRQFPKAEDILNRIKRLDPETDIEDLAARVRAGIASASSTDTSIFVPTNDKKRNSKRCAQLARDALKRKDIVVAEQFLLDAKYYYKSMELEPLFKELENLKKSCDDIPTPSYEHSNSSTRFACNPEYPETPSYHLPTNIPKDNYEKHFKTAQFALTNGDIEKAEYYAGECDKLWPNTTRVKGLRDDINKQKPKHYDGASKTRSGLVYKTTNEHCCDHKAQAERLFNSAQDAYLEQNYHKAQDLLRQVESLHPLPQVQELLKLIEDADKPKYQGNAETNYNYQQQTSTEPYYTDFNHDEVSKCVKVAEEALLNDDIEKAEKFINKAARMSSTQNDKFTEILEKINVAKDNKQKVVSKMTYSEVCSQKERKVVAEQCLDVARDAMSAGDYNKTEHFLIKANRSYPSQQVEDITRKVKYQKEIYTQTTLEHTSECNAEASTTAHVEPAQLEAERLFGRALNAMENNAFYLSEILLSKSISTFKLEAANDMLTIVQKEIDARVKSDSRSKLDSSKEKEAEVLYKMAQKKFQDGDLDNAQSLTLISLAFAPKSVYTKKLLQSIVDAKYIATYSQSEVSKKGDSNFNNKRKITEYKAACYIEMANTFKEARNYELAKEFLKKADELCPSVKTKQLLVEVRSLANNSSSSVLKSSWSYLCSSFKNLF